MIFKTSKWMHGMRWVFCFILASNAYSTVIHVPAEQSTIQAGIDASTHGDTVLVQPGTYIENINYNGKNIVVGSLTLTTGDTTYISQTVIDGNQSGSVVTVESGEDSTTVICGFTLTNGSGNPYPVSTFGGGIYCRDSNLTIIKMQIVNNHVDSFGGGVHSDSSNIIIRYTTISNNFAGSFGGGISSTVYSELLMTDVHIINNQVSSGGVSGGGIIAFLYTTVHMENVYILNNSSMLGGGLSSTAYCNLNLQNVEISGNRAFEIFGGGHGGGIYQGGNSNLNCNNVTIIENLADGYGYGIYIVGQNQDIILNNSIIWNSVFNNIHFDEDPLISYDNFLTISYSDINGGEESIDINNAGTLNWLEGNLDEDPLFFDPENGNYQLLPESPCIDAGDPDSELDPDGTVADMGAYYFHQDSDCHVLGDVNLDSELDVSDIVIMVGCILEETGNCDCADMNDDQLINVTDIVLMVDEILQS